MTHTAGLHENAAAEDARRRVFRYQPFYCEENAWWLCAEPALGEGPRHVVFITNRIGLCPFAAQRAAAPGEIIWWDYHCVVLDGAGRLWDLDSRLAMPLPAAEWLARSFPFAPRLPAELKPCFRLVPADDYRRDFASDRSHMRRASGGWQRPPPPWPCIGAGMNLPTYLDLADAAATGPGTVLNWDAMRLRCSQGEEAR